VAEPFASLPTKTDRALLAATAVTSDWLKDEAHALTASKAG
jgi:hypothetical protein